METSRLLEFVELIVASEDLTREAKQGLDGSPTGRALCAIPNHSGVELDREQAEATLGSDLASSTSCLASSGRAGSSVLTMLQKPDLDEHPAWLRLPSIPLDAGSLCW